MTRQRRVMLGTAWATFALGTVVSLSLNAGVTGCSPAHNQQAQPPSAAAVPSPAPVAEAAPNPGASKASADDCMPRYLGATKAAPVLPPGCERPHPAAPSNQGMEQAPQQAQ